MLRTVQQYWPRPPRRGWWRVVLLTRRPTVRWWGRCRRTYFSVVLNVRSVLNFMITRLLPVGHGRGGVAVTVVSSLWSATFRLKFRRGRLPGLFPGRRGRSGGRRLDGRRRVGRRFQFLLILIFLSRLTFLFKAVRRRGRRRGWGRSTR